MAKATQFELGLIGLGTMGMNLLLNLADRGNVVAGYSRDRSKSAELRELPADNIQGFDDLAEFVAALRIPRVVLLLVPAGPTVDSVVAGLRPLLARGDFIVDAGNSFHRDTTRRIAELAADGIEFVGMGVSGGESGARHGPSMMPGGGQRAWERLGPLLESAAARVGDEPCVAPMGEGAAGHYVKMIHNGIEYALMQMLAECYDLMRRRLGMSNEQMAAEFARWNAGRLQSYLVEITVEVLRTPEPHGAGALVDAVLDRARAKGTGKWSSQDAMDLGVPVPAIDAAVSARELSAYKTERLRLAPLYSDPPAAPLDRAVALEALERAYHAGAWIAYAQGLAQIAQASAEYGFGTELATVARIWRAGCIIRAAILDPIAAAFASDPVLPNLLAAPVAVRALDDSVDGLRATLRVAIDAGIPAPALAAALAYFDGMRSARLPANLIQAQRDLFGAHTYERTDRDGVFHSAWGAP
ncbi:MAG: 6-phosphogluconate dehydrogenase, NADP(+)-dependent, decarboxylating [Pseudomonadales bacterium]|nr:6-phosphogluconate dehydrogenase, NADP(+)-dependent, decarboxylating [Pseudomonadales bacterium]